MVVGLVGCGRIGFDAGVTADGATDAALVIPANCTRYSFDGPPLAPPLIPFGPGQITIAGTLRCEITGAPIMPCGVQTSPNRDFSGASVWFRLPEATTRIDTVNGLGWHAPSENVHLFVSVNELRFEDTTATIVRRGSYDKARQQWLRIDDTGTELLARTSPDGITWTDFDRLPRFDLSDVHLDLGSDAVADGGPDFAIYDDLVLCF